LPPRWEASDGREGYREIQLQVTFCFKSITIILCAPFVLIWFAIHSSWNANQWRIPVANVRVKEAAQYLGLSKSFLDKARIYGGGPAFMKFGTAVVYSTDALDAWMQACTVANDNAKPAVAA
jgi:excisionase family DNA binding protein